MDPECSAFWNPTLALAEVTGGTLQSFTQMNSMKTRVCTEETTACVQNSTQQYIIQLHPTHDTGFTYAFDLRIIRTQISLPFRFTVVFILIFLFLYQVIRKVSFSSLIYDK